MKNKMENEKKKEIESRVISHLISIGIALITTMLIAQGALADDWPMFMHDASHTGVTADIVKPPLNLIWEYSVPVSVSTSPAVSNGVVYVGSTDGSIYARNASDGAEKWKYTSESGFRFYSPTVSNDVVYVGSDDWNVYALNAADGSLIWQYKTEGHVRSAPVISNGIVYVTSTSGVYALNVADGSLKWRYITESTFYCSPVVSNGIVYVTTVAITASIGGTIDGYVYALDAFDGSVKWQYKVEGYGIYSSPSVSNGIVYAGARNGGIYALNVADGSLKWKYPTTDSIIGSSPAISNEVVYVVTESGDNTGNIYAINTADGSLKWKYTTGYISSSPAISNGIVYVGSDSGNIYGLDTLDGSLKWKYLTDSIDVGSFAISNAFIYGINNNHIFALGSLSSISGQKFEDINGNGIKDAEDPGLQGWTMSLTRPDGTFWAKLTDANGNYKFDNLSIGLYKINEIPQNGWIETKPGISKYSAGLGAANYSIYINPGEVIQDKDFGNYKLGIVQGQIFNDINGNGNKDRDPGLPEWNVTIEGIDTFTGEFVTQTTTTDSNGNYQFTNLGTGTYTIREILQNGWIQTAPTLSSADYTITITNTGTVISDKDFGNFKPGEIHGMKFDDLNANGQLDPNIGETGLPGWIITLTGTGIVGNITQTVTTDANGSYQITGLSNGTYIINEILQNGWIEILPTAGTYTVDVSSGYVKNNQNFGNFHKGKISGAGWISIPGDSKATFDIVGQYPSSSNTPQGHIMYQDHGNKLNIKSTQINTVAITPDSKIGIITGVAQVNGDGSYPFEVYVEDNSKSVDMFKISLPTYPYSNGGELGGGNIQIIN